MAFISLLYNNKNNYEYKILKLHKINYDNYNNITDLFNIMINYILFIMSF